MTIYHFSRQVRQVVCLLVANQISHVTSLVEIRLEFMGLLALQQMTGYPRYLVVIGPLLVHKKLDDINQVLVVV